MAYDMIKTVLEAENKAKKDEEKAIDKSVHSEEEKEADKNSEDEKNIKENLNLIEEAKPVSASINSSLSVRKYSTASGAKPLSRQNIWNNN